MLRRFSSKGLLNCANAPRFNPRSHEDFSTRICHPSRVAQLEHYVLTTPTYYGCQARFISQAAASRMEQRSRSMVMYLTAVVIGMVGMTYASVPLYRRFCQATGYGGTVQRRETVEEKISRHSHQVVERELTVQFNSDVSDRLQWRFTPCQHSVKVKPGESSLAFFTAENLSSEPITGVSTYNVTPMKAGVYFNKIQCFCFEEQRLLPGEKIDMPVFFYVDPEFVDDPKMNDVNSLVLSYTFFKVDE